MSKQCPLSKAEIKDLLTSLARLSQRGIMINSSQGKLITEPVDPNDSDFKEVEPILKELQASSKLFEVKVNSTEVKLTFTNTAEDTYKQFKEVAERELGDLCGLPGGKTINIAGRITFNPKVLLKRLSLL